MMKWRNLVDFKCPSCGAILNKKEGKDTYACLSCHYQIRVERFEEILKSMFSRSRPRTEEDNLQDLNNLGHEVVTEDFSDSNALNY